MKAVYQLRITLKHIRPPVWREVQVPLEFRLEQLHTLIQAVMGWGDHHLHEFDLDSPSGRRTPGRRFAPMEVMDEFFDDEVEDESEVSIGELCPQVNDKLAYVYDFGDHWIHEIKVQKILPASPDEQYPLCLKGKRACPPEDCGGIPGYENLLEVLSDPGDEEYGELLDWAGEDFDPEAFDLDAVAGKLREIDWS